MAKAKTPVEAPASASTDHTPSDTPTQSNARNSNKTGTAPRVLSAPSSAQPVPTHQSTCLLSSSSTLGSDKKHISANLEGTNDRRTCPLWTTTATAITLLQELHFGETEEAEHDPEGVFVGNDEVEDEDEDDGSGDEGDEGGDGFDTGIDMIEGQAAKKGPSKVPAVWKKQKLQAIDEESSSNEFGEYFC